MSHQTKEHRRKLSLAQPNRKEPAIELLVKLYVENQLGTHAIAAKLGMSQMTVRRWFRRLKISTRSLSEASSITLNGFKQEEQHLNWKGDDVGYQALHTWVRKHLGTPHVCSHCESKRKKKYEWANISGEYRRDLFDWVRLCTKCHRKMDTK